MNPFQLQKQQLDFQLRVIAGLPSLLHTPRWSHIDDQTTDLILEQAVRLATEKLAPLAASGDRQGCKLEQGSVRLPAGSRQTWEDWCELGFPMLALSLDQDGMEAPMSVQCAIQEICDAANMAFGMLAINQRCAIAALTSAVIPEASAHLVEQWLPRLGTGEITSTIAISEPQAGSDVGRILTSASEQEDGSWILNGSKIWISYGDHDATDQILHLMLARVPNGEAGTRGLGLFAVPKYLEEDNQLINGISVLRIEEKMGLHASPTCVLDIKDARGWLIGEPGMGLQALFVMMNGMRLAVSVQGAAIANAAALQAMAYASERPQGGRPDSAPVMITAHADVRRMLLEMIADSELARAFSLRTASLLDQSAATEANAGELLELAELLLPMAKTLGAEAGFRTANTGIQVLGGYGYTCDYPLERMARDIRVSSIYEGTSGVQALDLLRRKILRNGGATLVKLTTLIKTDLEHGDSPFRGNLQELLQLHQDTLPPFRSGSADNEGAYAFLQLTGLLVHCWNGHALHVAADPARPEQARLRAALEYFSTGLLASARFWANRCVARLPACTFSA